MKPTINIFGLNISSNYFMIFIGFLSMTIVNIIMHKKFKISVFKAILMSVIVNIFAIAGALLMFKLENIGNENFYNNGLSFFGTVLFLPLFMKLFDLIFKTGFTSDKWGLTIPLELTFVRFGCFLAGCCGGVISEFGLHFATDIEEVTRVPIQLFECFFDFSIFILLLYLIINNKNKFNVYAVFMVLYSFIRFILEIFRDTNKNIIGLSNGQIFAFICFIIGVIWSYKHYYGE